LHGGRATQILPVSDVKARGEMIVKRCFFPSHGRIDRRINARKERGQVFVGSVWSFWWGRSARSSSTTSLAAARRATPADPCGRRRHLFRGQRGAPPLRRARQHPRLFESHGQGRDQRRHPLHLGIAGCWGEYPRRPRSSAPGTSRPFRRPSRRSGSRSSRSGSRSSAAEHVVPIPAIVGQERLRSGLARIGGRL
jgi:hypothetical protein